MKRIFSSQIGKTERGEKTQPPNDWKIFNSQRKNEALMNQKAVLCTLLTIASVGLTYAQTLSPAITEDELRAHVRYLASDELEGRGSGTEGNEKAATFIADKFREYGLLPGGDNGTFRQTFDFVSALKLGNNNSLSFIVEGKQPVSLQVDTDFRPLGLSANGTVKARLIFAGYGMTVAEKQYDDYQDINVNGKIVVVLRYSPDGTDPHSEFTKHSSLRNKARLARDKGAVAMVLVTAASDQADDELIKLSYDHAFANSGIQVICMTRAAFERILGGTTVTALQDSIKATGKASTVVLPPVELEMTTDIEKVMGSTANVIGYIEGAESTLKGETVVIGAHMDHLGFGGPGSGSLMPDEAAIHNGADDNASGTAALLEIAQAMATERARPARSIVFVAFSGEELGTLGSAHYVNHPLMPMNNTIAMLNMDMVGRLNDNTLTVYGTGTSSLWTDFVKSHNRKSGGEEMFTIKSVADGFGPSDHAQFYSKDVPVLFFFTGTHNDYHKPSDDWDKLNYEGQERIARMVLAMGNDLARMPQRPDFVRVASSSPTAGGDTRGFAVTLGVIPDYGETSEGMKIGGLRPNGPAEKAGLKAGDSIVRMAGKKVLNIYDYMGLLGELKVGDEVDVVVTREGKEMTFKAKMEKRQ